MNNKGLIVLIAVVLFVGYMIYDSNQKLQHVFDSLDNEPSTQVEIPDTK